MRRWRAVRPCGGPRRSPWRSWAPGASRPRVPRRTCSTSHCSCRIRTGCRPRGPEGTGRSLGRTRSMNRNTRERQRPSDATRPDRSGAGDHDHRAGTIGSNHRGGRTPARPRPALSSFAACAMPGLSKPSISTAKQAPNRRGTRRMAFLLRSERSPARRCSSRPIAALRPG
jgi:hypothetical protein